MRRMARFKTVRILQNSSLPLRMVNIVDTDYVGDASTWLETSENSRTFETVRDSGGALRGFKYVKISGYAGNVDVTAPTILTSSTANVDEGTIFSITLTANESVTWSKVGGADTALFTLVGAVLSLPAKDYETPGDADTNNTYVVTVRATDGADPANTTDKTITVTVVNVTGPNITSSNTGTVAENSAFSMTLTANESVNWTKPGGADTSLFTLTGATLGLAARDYEDPDDANTDNAYVVQVRATSVATGEFTNQTITVTVINVLGLTGPTLEWITDGSDNTPRIDLTEANVGDLAEGRTVVFQRDTVNTFDGADFDEYSNVVDAGEDLAGALSFDTGGAWADDTWYVRGRIDGDEQGEWSNTVSQTIAAATGDITTGLKGYWLCNEGSGSTAADSSGNSHTLTVGQTGNWGVGYYDFVAADNSTLFVADHADFTPGSSITVFGWIKAGAQTGKPVISQYDYDTANRSWALFLDDSVAANRLRFFGSGNGASTGGGQFKIYDGSQTISVNVDHSVAWRFNSGTVDLFVDGVKDPSPTATQNDSFSSLFNSTANLVFGSYGAASPADFFNGRGHKFRLYTGTNKTDADIAAMHAVGV